MGIKQRLLQTIERHMTPQTAAYAPMLAMVIQSMSEEQVAGMLREIRTLLSDLLEA